MTPTQREAALRLADEFERGWWDVQPCGEAAALLRELAAEPDKSFVRERAQLEQEWCELRQLQAQYKQSSVEPQAEPVAWQLPGTDSFLTSTAKKHHGVRAAAYTKPLYTQPQQRKEKTA